MQDRVRQMICLCGSVRSTGLGSEPSAISSDVSVRQRTDSACLSRADYLQFRE